MRILWVGDAADTGFGTVTKEIGRRLLANGHDVRFIMQNMSAWPLEEPFASRSWNRMLFQSDAEIGMLIQAGFRDHWKAEQVVLLADYFAAEATVNALPEAWHLVPTWHYAPVEGHDLPPAWANGDPPSGLAAGLWSFIHPIAMTRFGANEISRITHQPTPFVYHGVNREVFHPATPETPLLGQNDEWLSSKAACKRNLGLDPSKIMLFRADRHMRRKGYNLMIRALEPVFAKRDDLHMVIHCREQDFGGALRKTFSKYPTYNGRVSLTGAHNTWSGVPANLLAVMYNAADIYLSSGAEGFGLTLAESLACGTPVLGIDYSAVPEVVGDAGILVDDLYLVDNEYDHYWAYPHEAAYAKALRKMLYPGEAARLGAKGPAQVDKFNWDEAARLFGALFESAAVAAAAA